MEELSVHKIRNEFGLKLKQTNQIVLHAPTGSGKSTLIPQFLIDDILLQHESVIVLQPRRIAARLLATYIAKERGVLLGEEVGYQVRLESKKSEKTRIAFVTEGVLLNRLLNHDPLTNIGAVVFDEFHERHLETDLSLALALKLQKLKRPDLKIVVMSATLNIAQLTGMLNNAQTLTAEGRTYPVTIKYSQPKAHENIWDSAANAMEASLPDFKNGSALVFMPGVYEIKKTIEALQKKSRLLNFQILPLYSSLPGADQDRAVQPGGGRKIIITTNVAETSITIPEITLVIDSGLARVAKFDSKRGINTLFNEPVSKSSADQRSGRAGRVAPGLSLRLWSEFSHEHRQANNIPEIHRLDLSETVLALLAAGENPETFPWVEMPEKLSLENGYLLLNQLGALQSGELTLLGRKMAKINVHPRLARMLVEAEAQDCLPSACVLVAITQSTGFLSRLNDPILHQERLDMFGHCGSDLIFELNAWLWAGAIQFKSAECSRLGISSAKARDIGKLAIQIHQKVTVKPHSLTKSRIDFDESVKLRKCILTGFSDYIAIRHKLSSPTCQMMYGRSGQLHRDSIVQDAQFLVVNEIEESKSPTGIQAFLRKVTQIEPEWLNDIFIGDKKKSIAYSFNKENNRVVQTTEYSVNQLVIRREQTEIADNDIAAQVLSKAIFEGEISFPQWDEEVEHFVRRVNFASLHAPHYGIPSIHEEEKEFIIEQTVYKCRSLKDVQKCDVWPALKSWLSYEQMEAVKVVAPEYVMLPHRKKPVKLRYDEKGDVILSETIQALYDCPLPVTVAEGKVQVIFELLAPSRRPVQITRDLEYFWKNSYLEIRKELKGRYPKHEWR